LNGQKIYFNFFCLSHRKNNNYDILAFETLYKCKILAFETLTV